MRVCFACNSESAGDLIVVLIARHQWNKALRGMATVSVVARKLAAGETERQLNAHLLFIKVKFSSFAPYTDGSGLDRCACYSLPQSAEGQMSDSFVKK